MDTKTHLNPTVAQFVNQIADQVLSLGNRHAVAGGNNNGRRIFQSLCHFLGTDFNVLTIITACNHGPFFGTKTTENHRNKGTIHGCTHQVGKNGTRRPHHGTGNDQQIVAQHKAGHCRCQTGIGIEHGYHHRHIRSANTKHQSNPESKRQKRNQHQCQNALLLHVDHPHKHRQPQNNQVGPVFTRQR